MDGRVSHPQRVCVCVCVCARARTHMHTGIHGDREQMSSSKPLEGGGDLGLGSKGGGGWVDLKNRRNGLGGNSMSKHVALETKCGPGRD